MARLDIRLLHGLAAGAALFVLMGANAEGCGGEPPAETTEEPGDSGESNEPCGPGAHLELACPEYFPMHEGEPGHEPGCEEPPECIEICVPDEVCPEGTVEELVCGPPMTEPGHPGGQFCLNPNGCAPWPNEGEGEPPPEPWPHEGEGEVPPGPGEGACQLICDEPMPEPFICLDPNGCELPPPPPGECFDVCVPDACGPGQIEEWFCMPVEPPHNFPNEGEPPPPEECFPTCVPMPEPELQ